jgi:hypothetical protein
LEVLRGIKEVLKHLRNNIRFEERKLFWIHREGRTSSTGKSKPFMSDICGDVIAKPTEDYVIEFFRIVPLEF